MSADTTPEPKQFREQPFEASGFRANARMLSAEESIALWSADRCPDMSCLSGRVYELYWRFMSYSGSRPWIRPVNEREFGRALKALIAKIEEAEARAREARIAAEEAEYDAIIALVEADAKKTGGDTCPGT